MSVLDDVLRLSVRENALSDDVRRRDSDPTLGLPNVLALTTTLSSYPTSAASYFACQPLALVGAEVEGGSGSVTSTSSPFLALNLGTAVPPNATQVLVTRVDNRWVFRYDG